MNAIIIYYRQRLIGIVMHFTLLLTAICLPIFLFGQTIQKGVVYELNSSKKPISGVEVTFLKAVPTDTDNDGGFLLHFSGIKYGEMIGYDRIYKKGYELVNEKDIQIAKLSQAPMKIVLCKKGYISQKRAEYYNISIASITAGHERRILALRRQLAEAKIAEEQFMMQRQKLSEEKEKVTLFAEKLAEQFARTNFDDVSDIYQKAFEQFQQGKIQEAIDILDKANLVDRATQRIVEQQKIADLRQEANEREIANNRGIAEDMEAIALAIELYMLQFDYEKAESLYQSLWKLDTTHVENTISYADFLHERKRYDLALNFQQKVIDLADAAIWQKANAYSHIGEIKNELGKFDEALKAYTNLNKYYTQLCEGEETPAFYTHNLAISYLQIGEVYQAQNKFSQQAQDYFLKYNQLVKQLYEANTENEDVKASLAISYSKLGEFYQAQQQSTQALDYFLNYYSLSKELFERDPQNINAKTSLAISYSKLGEIYKTQGEPLEALDYFLEQTALFEELHKDNPKSIEVKRYLALSYAKVGGIYQSQKEWDEALNYYFLQKKISEELYEENPRSIAVKNSLAIVYSKLGTVYQKKDDSEKALHYFLQEIKLSKELYAANPKNENLKTTLSVSLAKLGEYYQKEGTLERALDYFLEYHKLVKELNETNPENVKSSENLGISYYKLGGIYTLLKTHEKALDAYKKTEKIFLSLHEQTGIAKYQKMANIALKKQKP